MDKQQCTSCHLIITATVSVMSPAETPTAEAKAMTFKRPANGRITRVISVTRGGKKGDEMMEYRSAAS